MTFPRDSLLYSINFCLHMRVHQIKSDFYLSGFRYWLLIATSRDFHQIEIWQHPIDACYDSQNVFSQFSGFFKNMDVL